MRFATTPVGTLAAIIQAAKTQRILVDLIGDSNAMYTEVAGNRGWHGGLTAGLITALGASSMWGTGLWSMNNGKSNESGALPGYRYGPLNATLTGISGNPAVYTVAHLAPEQGGGTIPNDANPPNELGDYCRWGGVAALPTWRPHFYGYLQDSATDSNSRAGIVVDTDCPININDALDGYTWYGTFPAAAGTGSFRPGWREQISNTLLGMAASINPMDPNAYGITFNVVRKAARAHGGRGVWFGPRIPGQGDIAGPFFGTYQQVVNPSRTTGCSVSTMLGLAGQSAFDMATAITTNTPAATIDHYFQARCQPVLDAGQSPRMLVVINAGLNDRGEAGNSINAAGTNISAAGYIDNVGSIISTLKARWIAGGRPAANITFLILVSHPQDDNPANSNESPLIGYRRAAEAYAAAQAGTTNVCVADLSQLVTVAEMKARDWIPTSDLAANRPHIKKEGYEAIAGRLFSQAVNYTASAPNPSVAPPASPLANVIRHGYVPVIAGDASADALAPIGFVPVQTVEQWLQDFRAGLGTGCIELADGDEAEFIFLSPGANNLTGTYLVTQLAPTFSKESAADTILGYVETRREAGALTVGNMAIGADGAAAIPGAVATDLVVDTITATLNKSGTEVDSPVNDTVASLRVKAQGACILRVQTSVGTAANGFRCIARRCKGDAFPSPG